MAILDRVRDFFRNLAHPYASVEVQLDDEAPALRNKLRNRPEHRPLFERSGQAAETSDGQAREYVLIGDYEVSERLKMAASRKNLHALAIDPDRSVRLEVAKQIPQLPISDLRDFLRVLVEDEDPQIRMEVARQCFQILDQGRDNSRLLNDVLGILERDSAASIRHFLVEQGWNLKAFVFDPDENIRIAVARRGYGLEILREDASVTVRDTVWEMEHNGGIVEHVPAFTAEEDNVRRAEQVENGFDFNSPFSRDTNQKILTDAGREFSLDERLLLEVAFLRENFEARNDEEQSALDFIMHRLERGFPISAHKVDLAKIGGPDLLRFLYYEHAQDSGAWMIRKAAIENPRCPLELLSDALYDRDWMVRKSAVMNSRTSTQDCIDAARMEGNPFVLEALHVRLGRLFPEPEPTRTSAAYAHAEFRAYAAAPGLGYVDDVLAFAIEEEARRQAEKGLKPKDDINRSNDRDNSLGLY